MFVDAKHIDRSRVMFNCSRHTTLFRLISLPVTMVLFGHGFLKTVGSPLLQRVASVTLVKSPGGEKIKTKGVISISVRRGLTTLASSLAFLF